MVKYREEHKGKYLLREDEIVARADITETKLKLKAKFGVPTGDLEEENKGSEEQVNTKQQDPTDAD